MVNGKIRDVNTIGKPVEKINESVSVIIPTFNRAQWVCEAVESVLSQTMPPDEVIVVDDGSTDETSQALRVFDGKITIVSQENRGVSAARNTGIRRSTGVFIALLDSDDLWEKDKIAHQVEFFRANPHALICQTGEIWIRNGKRVNPMNKHRKRSGMIYGPSLHLCLVSPSAVMIRRGLLDGVGLFDESLPACEDYDLWLRISCRYPVYTTGESHVIKRGGHDDQLSKAPGLDRFRIRAMKKMLESGLLTPDQRLETLGVLKEKCMIYAQGCQKRGRDEEASHYFRLAEAYDY
jgi:glycosyltransferase involved in cell wall biosynthesis